MLVKRFFFKVPITNLTREKIEKKRVKSEDEKESEKERGSHDKNSMQRRKGIAETIVNTSTFCSEDDRPA